MCPSGADILFDRRKTSSPEKISEEPLEKVVKLGV